MMMSKVQVQAPNSMIFVSGGKGEVPTETVPHSGVWMTSTMIVVSTLVEFDGPTNISLSSGDAEPGDLECVFSGHLSGIDTKLFVTTWEGSVLLSADATGPVIAVEIFTNDWEEPDEILIVFGPA